HAARSAQRTTVRLTDVVQQRHPLPAWAGISTGGTAVVVLVATAHGTAGGRRRALHLPGCDLWMLELQAAAAAAALVQFGVLAYVLMALWIVARGLLLVFLVVVRVAVDAFVQSVGPEAMQLGVGVGDCCVADMEDYTGGGVGDD
ncbi:hypothetical protein HK405_001327, partial [Cladochytrium tenue]